MGIVDEALAAGEPLLTCAWCGEDFERENRMGHPATYCSHAHRQRAYEARRMARDTGISYDKAAAIVRRRWLPVRIHPGFDKARIYK